MKNSPEDSEYKPESDIFEPPKMSRQELERQLLESGRFCWNCKQPLMPHDLKDCECNNCGR
jgi:hypothetical protein